MSESVLYLLVWLEELEVLGELVVTMALRLHLQTQVISASLEDHQK